MSSFGWLRIAHTTVALAVLANVSSLHGEEPILTEDFSDENTSWQSWSPRGEIMPTFTQDPRVGRGSPGSLSIKGSGNAAAFGAWRRTIDDITPGRTYQFEVWHRTEGVENDLRSVIPRLHWKNAQGEQARPPDFPAGEATEDGWSRVEYVTVAPENAAQVEIQLGFGFAEDGQVWFDDVRFEQVDSPDQRVVRIATIHHQPRGTRDASENVEQFAALVEKAAAQHPDIICLPEGITVAGNPQSYIEVSEPVPGPVTRRLAELSKRHHCYLVAGIYERDGICVYNTAVLLGREGELVGKYRKTHLPREEWQAGLTPGDEYPVFETDFGRVGLMICWDVQFPEPARAMARQGAELLLLPIWGGSEVLALARAIENHVFLVSSSYGMRSFVLDPVGEILAEATQTDPIAVAEVNLDHQFFQPWLGNMKHRTWKERRPDIPVD